MDVANQVNQVVDKVAEKLGVVAEQAEPVVQRVLAEYAMKETTMGIGILVLVVLTVAMLWIGRSLIVRAVAASGVTYLAECVAAARGLSGGLAGAISAILIGATGYHALWCFARAASPLYHCLKELVAS